MFRTWGSPRQSTDTQDTKSASRRARRGEQSTQSSIFSLTIFILVSHIKRSPRFLLFPFSSLGGLKIDEKCLKINFCAARRETHWANIVEVSIITITVSPFGRWLLLSSRHRELFDFTSHVDNLNWGVLGCSWRLAPQWRLPGTEIAFESIKLGSVALMQRHCSASSSLNGANWT